MINDGVLKNGPNISMKTLIFFSIKTELANFKYMEYIKE